MTLAAAQKRTASFTGFTLVELLLVVGLMSLFTGAAIVSFSSIGQGAELNLGAVRFEGLLRFAKAEAANSGRRVRVTFMPDMPNAGLAIATNQSGQIRVAWEPKPLDQPDVFEDLPVAQWGADHVADNIDIQTVRLIDPNDTTSSRLVTDTNLVNVAEPAEAPVTAQPPAITFNPDGSSDSAEIILAARNSDDSRRIAVRIEGLTGSISHSVICEEVSPANGDDLPEQGASTTME